MTDLLHLAGVEKRFGVRRALGPVDFRVGAGEIVLVMGPNACGKTTLLKISAGLLPATSGTVRTMGHDPRRHAHVRRRLSYLGHELGLYDELTAEENLLYYAGLYGLRDRAARARSALEIFRLADRSGDMVRSFSRGLKERLALARITLHDPQLILLDEPTTGLDASSTTALVDVLSSWRAAGRSVVMATHEASMAERLGARVERIGG